MAIQTQAQQRTIKRSSILNAITKAQQRNALILDLGGDRPGERWYVVQSHSEPERGYLLRVREGKVDLCTCPGFEHSGFCWHRAAVGLKPGLVPKEWIPQPERAPIPSRTARTIRSILESGELEGYTEGAPDGAEIDRQVCAEGKCPECGHQGMAFWPFHRPGSYRAFAVCPHCSTATEF